MTIRFMAIRKDTIKLLLRKICNKEKVQISSEALTELAERSSGDLRSAINDLQSVCEGKSKVSIEDVYALGYRDNRETIFSALGKIFKTSSLAKARNATKELEEPPDYVILWIDENLPLEYKDLTDLKNGYERLSRADVFLGRILKRQYYDLWAYTNDLLTGGVALAKRTTYRGFTKYQFPSWLSKMGRTRTARDIQKTVLEKIGRLCHTSRAVVREDILHWFKYLFKSQQEFAINIIAKLGLQEEEIAWLLDEKIDSTKVKRLIKASEKLASKKEVTIKEYG
jgi:replication factor C large subunit